MPFAAAAGIGAAASIGSSLIFGNEQANAVKGAASQARQDLQPFVTPGVNALGVASNLAGANGPDAATAAMANFHTDPGYQFQLDQGLRAVDAGAAGKGILRSGATLKAEQTFGTGLADQSFSQYFNRLFDLSKLGQASAADQAGVSQAQGKQLASIFGNEGQAIGSSISGLTGNAGVNSLFGGGSGGVIDSGTFSF